MSTHSRSLRALVILILPLTIITLLITTTLLPSNHPISPLSRLSYAGLETDMETLSQHGMRAFNLLVNQMGGRGMGVHFRAPWAGRNAFVPATRLVNTGAMSAFGVGGDVTSMTSPSASTYTTTTTSELRLKTKSPSSRITNLGLIANLARIAKERCCKICHGFAKVVY